MRPTGYWRPAGLREPLLGSYFRLADKILLDPRTRRIFAGGTSGLCVLMIGRVSPNCALVLLGPVAFKLAEREVLSASLCTSPRRLLESLWVPFHRGFRDGTTSFSRDGVRLTSRSLYLELVGWVGSPPQQLDSSMEYHVSA